jgi:PBP1b-binding outer membrane lipoprotein LpoB
MQPSIRFVFAVMMAAFLFVGCGNETSTQTPTVPDTQEEEGRVDPSNPQEEQPAGEETAPETQEQK